MDLPTERQRFRCKVSFIHTDTPLSPTWGAPWSSGSHVLPAVSQHLGGGEEEVLPAHLAVVGPLQG